jgi:hypothetical protein
MNKTQWKYDLVETPFCGQPKAMGWQWSEGGGNGLNINRRTDRVQMPERPEVAI